MLRPNLTQADLSEVDRLIALTNVCGGTSLDPVHMSMNMSRRMSGIRLAALRRSAEILGLDDGIEDDPESEDE